MSGDSVSGGVPAQLSQCDAEREDLRCELSAGHGDLHRVELEQGAIIWADDTPTMSDHVKVLHGR